MQHQHQPEQDPTGPLLRDPPPPPGYVDPIEESDVLEDPFARDRTQSTEDTEQVRTDVSGDDSG